MSRHKIPAERIMAVNKMIPSPEQRTIKVYAHLRSNPEINHWDTICFCVAYLVNSVLTYPFIKDPAIRLAQIIKFFHYTSPQEVDELQPNDQAGLSNVGVLEPYESNKESSGTMEISIDG